MKWLFLLFSIFKPFMSSDSQMVNPVTEIKEMITANAAKVVVLFATASALATIFAAGIVIIAVDIGAQYDQNAYVYFSTMITMGLVLSLVSLVIGAIVVRAFQGESREEKREILSNIGTSHPLQDALALLISDFVKEREMRREEAPAERQHTSRPHHEEEVPQTNRRH